MQPEPVAPAGEAVIADEAVLPQEPRRKLWRVIPIFSAGVLYDDNIFLTNTNRVADVIWTISGGLAFELGDFRSETENYLTALWVGIPIFYTDNPEENSFDQKAALAVQYRWSKLVGKFESNFSIERAGNREVNTITTNQTFSNRLRFTYDYSEKTSFDLQFSQLSTKVDSPSGTHPGPFPWLSIHQVSIPWTSNSQYEAKAGMNYQMFPKTKIGFEGAGGIVDQASSPLQYYQQIRLRINYVATGKLNFKFSGGVEAREFEGRDNIKITPVFSLGLEYRPFDGTGISMIGYRNISAASSLTGQDVTATGFEIAATQRFLQKFIAGINFGYENDVYFATSGETPADSDRVDNYLFVRPKLSYSLVRWASVNVFYEYRRTVSSQTTSSFMTIELAWRLLRSSNFLNIAHGV